MSTKLIVGNQKVSSTNAFKHETLNSDSVGLVHFQVKPLSFKPSRLLTLAILQLKKAVINHNSEFANNCQSVEVHVICS